MRRKWSAAEIAKLKRLWTTMTTKELCATLGRSDSSVYQQCIKLGLRCGHRTTWGPQHDSAMRSLNHQGHCDTAIAAKLGCERHTVSRYRKAAGLPDRSNEAKRHNPRRQLQSLGIAHLSHLRLAAWAARAMERGWPTQINGRPIGPRHIQILDTLRDKGPHTRQQLASAIGMPWKGSRRSLVSNGAGGSYLAELMRDGLVVQLGRMVKGKGKGKGHSVNLYALALNAERNHG